MILPPYMPMPPSNLCSPSQSAGSEAPHSNLFSRSTFSLISWLILSENQCGNCRLLVTLFSSRVEALTISSASRADAFSGARLSFISRLIRL